MEGASREQYEDRVKALGGKVTSAVSTRTSYLVYGEVLEDGRNYTEGKKYLKAKELKTKVLSQVEFEEMVKKHESDREPVDSPQSPVIDPPLADSKPVVSRYSSQQPATDSSSLWTDKHAPKALADLIGNGTIVQKLMQWLTDWESVVLAGEKKEIIVRGHFDPQRNVNARAALLSGPPGIGKTTAARLVASALGYRAIELNASDARSKAALTPIKSSSKNVVLTSDGKLVKAVVIMDEVDGMAGGDRGGVGAVVEIIREAAVPVICICNDRNSQKLKSLVNVCYDLRFVRPTKQQIAARLLSVARNEGLQVEPNALDRLVESSGHDIRQVMTMLEMWARTRNTLSYMDVKHCEHSFEKDESNMIGNFEAAGILLRRSESSKRNLRGKLDLFFIDYQLIPLLIHENYLSAIGPDLDQLSKSCDSVAFADVLEKHIRTDNEWSLLPMYGIASAVEPGVRSGMGVPFPRFPEWFGKFSTQRKNERLLRELRAAMAGFVSADNEDVLSDYVPLLYRLLVNPLQELGKDGIEEVLEIMNTYNLTPDMLKEHLVELQFDPDTRGKDLKDLPAPVKSALTRVFNAYNAGGSEKRSKRTLGDNSDQQGRFDPDIEEAPGAVSSDTEPDDSPTPAKPSRRKTKKPKK